jgi:hypothetical protein
MLLKASSSELNHGGEPITIVLYTKLGTKSVYIRSIRSETNKEKNM